MLPLPSLGAGIPGQRRGWGWNSVSREVLRVALSSQTNAAPRAPWLWYQTGKVLGVAHDFATFCLWPLDSQGLPLPTKRCLSSSVQSRREALAHEAGSLAADGEPRAALHLPVGEMSLF